MDVAMGLISVAPAYVALVAEAWIDAGIARGIPADQASQLVAEAIAGSGDLLVARGVDTLGCGALSRPPAGSPPRGSPRWRARAYGPRSATRSTPCSTT